MVVWLFDQVLHPFNVFSFGVEFLWRDLAVDSKQIKEECPDISRGLSGDTVAQARGVLAFNSL